MNIKDCKCGAKYVKGLPAIDNGQILNLGVEEDGYIHS